MVPRMATSNPLALCTHKRGRKRAPVDVVDAGPQLGYVAVALVQQLQPVARRINLGEGRGRNSAGRCWVALRAAAAGSVVLSAHAAACRTSMAPSSPAVRGCSTTAPSAHKQTANASGRRAVGSQPLRARRLSRAPTPAAAAPERRALRPGLPGWRVHVPLCHCGAVTAAAGPRGTAFPGCGAGEAAGREAQGRRGLMTRAGVRAHTQQMASAAAAEPTTNWPKCVPSRPHGALSPAAAAPPRPRPPPPPPTPGGQGSARGGILRHCGVPGGDCFEVTLLGPYMHSACRRPAGRPQGPRCRCTYSH